MFWAAGCGGLATRGARSRAHAAYRPALSIRCGRSRGQGAPRDVRADAPAIGLDGRPKPASRIRAAGGAADSIRRHAEELVALAPDVIVNIGSVTVAPLQQGTRSIPIVMVNVADPVGAGFVQSLARPGGNTTGFTNFEYSMSGKWVELLKEIAPRVTRAAVLRDPTAAAGIGQFAAIQWVAQSLGVELTPVGCATSPKSNAALPPSRAPPTAA